MNNHWRSSGVALLLAGISGCTGSSPAYAQVGATPKPVAAAAPTAPAAAPPPSAPYPANPGLTILTLGGGYSPTGNQISLERNVLYFQRVLQQLGLAARPNTILFADGNDPTRDLQFIDPQHPPTPVNLLLARIFSGNNNGLYDSYRDHNIPSVAGPAVITNVDRWFGSCAAQLKPGDRALLYFTGHGGHADKTSAGNTRMHLWAGQNLTVKEFTERLDKLPAGVPITMVMVQCFSGGFANIIFEGGDPAKDLTPRPRAGFFATVQDRTAAGCTADINEADYQEYSSEFFAALCGTDRMGRSVTKPDFNHDGVISFNEAHAYAIIHEITIDIPVKTSDALLRKYSGFTAPAGKTVGNLLTAQSPYPQLLAASGPCEHAILEALSEQLKLTGDDRVAAAQKAANDVQAKRTEQQQNKMKAQRELDGLRPQLSALLATRWPELANPWHPHVGEIIKNEAQAVMRTLQSHPQFARFKELTEQIDAAEMKSLELEKSWARHQRFIRAAENVALQANLPKLATPAIQARYAALVALEAETLGKG